MQPEEPVDKWTYPPYGGVVAKGRLWGRGATDNKSGVLAFTKAGDAPDKLTTDLDFRDKSFYLNGQKIR